ncbi:MAG: hypothetical protein LBG80_19055 [Bacteroidales bacterium]|jgi:hypothetical protein|nr:hypothetical protein [Bacteroidales bacterium]
MKVKKNNSKNVFLQKNDAVKGTYKYWKEMLEYPVYHYGMSYEQVKKQFNYGSRKPYWLSTNWWKKRFDAGYTYWAEKRAADMTAGNYTQTTPQGDTPKSVKDEETLNMIIYGLVGIVVLIIGVIIYKKLKKK